MVDGEGVVRKLEDVYGSIVLAISQERLQSQEVGNSVKYFWLD